MPQAPQPKLCIIAEFHYNDPVNDKPFIVTRQWACKSNEDGRLIITYHGFKTGSTHANCRYEEQP